GRPVLLAAGGASNARALRVAAARGLPAMRIVLEVVFWLSCGLIVWTQAGYALALVLLARVLGAPRSAPATVTGTDRAPSPELPRLSLIVAAHDEEGVIATRVANALALEAGADLVLELPRGGKIRAQDAAVERAGGEIVAFSDANSFWEADAARALAAAFADPRVGYACGQVRFVRGAGESNQEGVYWRYELGIRALESRLSSITAGNGAIYATRRDAYVVVD